MLQNSESQAIVDEGSLGGMNVALHHYFNRAQRSKPKTLGVGFKFLLFFLSAILA